jgi:hypothetical protein
MLFRDIFVCHIGPSVNRSDQCGKKWYFYGTKEKSLIIKESIWNQKML